MPKMTILRSIESALRDFPDEVLIIMPYSYNVKTKVVTAVIGARTALWSRDMNKVSADDLLSILGPFLEAEGLEFTCNMTTLPSGEKIVRFWVQDVVRKGESVLAVLGRVSEVELKPSRFSAEESLVERVLRRRKI